MDPVSYDDIRYDQVRARGSHNSYLRDKDIPDQMVYWRLRHVELDLHNTIYNRGSRGDWFVYHENVDSQRYSTVVKFTDGLKVLAGFHAAVPQHEVVTVALDLKSNLDADHQPAVLDALIDQYLPGLVYKASEFAGTHDHLQDAAAGGWPLLKDLRGKFVFICTTGDLDDPGSHLNQYIAGGAKARTCFVAPQISDAGRLVDSRYVDAVFFNMDISVSPDIGPRVLAAGYVSRGFGGNSQADFQKGIDGHNHLIGTDQVNSLKYTWSNTSTPRGWPFEGNGIEVDPLTTEPGTEVGLAVTSGDLYGRSDSCAFLEYADTAPATDAVYTYAVAVPGSNVSDRNAKAGLMVRASLDPDAANFAILRVAEKDVPRAQVRRRRGESTSEYKLDTFPTTGNGIMGNSWIHVRLSLSNGGTTVEGRVSYDGQVWVSLRVETFDAPLAYIGLVGSSHNTGVGIEYRFIPIRGFTGNAGVQRIGDGVAAASGPAESDDGGPRRPPEGPDGSAGGGVEA